MVQFTKTTVPLVFGMKHPYEMQIQSGTNENPRVYVVKIQVCTN